MIITGDGKTFSAGGDLNHERKVCEDYALRMQAMTESRNLVLGMINCRKPIVGAARGWAVGAGLALLILADVSIASQDAKFSDGHLKIGVAAGDHAAIIWPLLCGMAKAKYYLMTAENFTGEEAERMNLISMALADEEVEGKAVEVASRLAESAPAGAALDQADAEPLAAPGRADLRCLAGAGIHRLRRARGHGGHRRLPAEARAAASTPTRRSETHRAARMQTHRRTAGAQRALLPGHARRWSAAAGG